jgi:hypothetical protein
MRLTYAYDRTVKINLRTVNQAALPLVVLHIGKKRDLSITPTRFDPSVQSTEVCDVLMGNLSMIIFPYESVNKVHMFFASERLDTFTSSGDEQLLLIPFFEKTATFSTSLPTTSGSLDCETLTESQVPTPKCPLTDAHSDEPSEPLIEPKDHAGTDCEDNPVEVNGYDDINLEPVNCPAVTGTVKLHYTTPEILKSVINGLKKPALKSWASTCDILHSNNPSMSKKRLCDLLDTSSLHGSVKAITLLTLLVKKLDDPTIRLESTTIGLSLSSSAAQRKKDLVQWYQEKFPGITKIEFYSSAEHTLVGSLPGNGTNEHLVEDKHILATSMDQSTKHQRDHKTGAKRNKKHRSKNKKVLEQTVPISPIAQSSERSLVNVQQNQAKANNIKVQVNTEKCSADLDPSSEILEQEPDTVGCNRENTQATDGASKTSPKTQGVGCNNCQASKNSLQILEESILSLKDELLHQNATTDLILSSHTASDSKLEQFLKRKLAPLEATIQQLRADLNTLRDTANEQNAMLATLAERCTGKASDSIDGEALHQNTEELKSNKRKIERLEIGQENIIAAMRTLSNKVFPTTSSEHNADHSVGDQELNSPDSGKPMSHKFYDTTKNNKNRIETLEIGQEKIIAGLRSLSSRVSSLQTPSPAVYLHSANNSTENATAHTVGDEDPPESWAQIVGDSEREAFTKVNRKNAKNHNPAQGPSGKNTVQQKRTQGSGQHRRNENASGSETANTAISLTTNGTDRPDNTSGRNHRERDITENSNSELSVRENSTSRNSDETRLRDFSHHDNSRRSPTRDKNDNNRYRRHTVLLLHDENFDEFNSERFNRQFHVHCFKTSSYASLTKQSKKLNKTIKRLRPDCIYVHTGMNDFLEKKSGLASNVKELAKHLLDTTKAQICFSALIPSSENTSLNDRIRLVNEETRNYISWLHNHEPEVKDRIFTFNNDKIGDYNSESLNAGLKLSDRGQKKLWIRLREGLKKTLRLPRTSYHDNNRSRRSTNRFSDE